MSLELSYVSVSPPFPRTTGCAYSGRLVQKISAAFHRYFPWHALRFPRYFTRLPTMSMSICQTMLQDHVEAESYCRLEQLYGIRTPRRHRLYGRMLGRREKVKVSRQGCDSPGF